MQRYESIDVLKTMLRKKINQTDGKTIPKTGRAAKKSVMKCIE